MQRNDETENLSEGPSRSAQKRDAKAVEQLAQRLAELSDAELARLPKSPELAKEIALARNTSGHGSRKRQIKHLAGLLRGNDDQREAIETSLDGHAVSQRQETMAFHHLEELRDRLCTAETFEAALAEVRSTYPHVEPGKLTRLAGSVHDHNDKRAAREIFRYLRKAEETRDA